MSSYRRTSKRSSRSGKQRYTGRNSGGRDLRDGVKSQPKPTDTPLDPPTRRSTGRRSGEAPNPARRLGTVTPTPQTGTRRRHGPDRCHIKYRLTIPEASLQLLSQADRFDHRDGHGHLAGMMAAEKAADLAHWRVLPANPTDAGTRDTTELDRIIDQALMTVIDRRSDR